MSEIVIVDPINIDTHPPEAPERHVEPHEPKPSKIVPVSLDEESPLKEVDDGRVAARLGTIFSFGHNDERWVVIRLEENELRSFTAQHETNGRTYRGLVRHVHKVLQY